MFIVGTFTQKAHDNGDVDFDVDVNEIEKDQNLAFE